MAPAKAASFPLAPPPMLPLALAAPQATCFERVCVDYGNGFVFCYDLPVPCDQPPPPPGLGSSAASMVIEQRFSIPDRPNIDDRWRHMVNHIEDHFGANTYDLFEEITTIGLAGWHAMHGSYRGFGYSIPFDWRDQIPTWAVSQEAMTSEQIWNTRNLDTNGGLLHFDTPGTYGYGGTPAYETLQSWGVSAADAARVVDQIFDAQANPRWSPNYRVLSIEAGGGTSAQKIARLDEWLSAHGIAPINAPPSDPGEFITSPAIIREILGRRFSYAHEFSDAIIADLFFLHDLATGVPRSALETIGDGDLRSYLVRGQQFGRAVANLTGRIEIPDPAGDPGFLRNVVKHLWRHGFDLSALPFRLIDDITLDLLGSGFGIPLFPLPNGPDWEEPIESPAVLHYMILARTRVDISAEQITGLLALYGVSSVPASFIATMSAEDAQRYLREWDAPIVDEAVIVAVIRTLKDVILTVGDVNAFEARYGLEDAITLHMIHDVSADQIRAFVGEESVLQKAESAERLSGDALERLLNLSEAMEALCHMPEDPLAPEWVIQVQTHAFTISGHANLTAQIAAEAAATANRIQTPAALAAAQRAQASASFVAGLRNSANDAVAVVTTDPCSWTPIGVT